MRKLKTIEIARISAEDYQGREKLPIVVVLDDVRSQYNVGSVFRTADAFAIEKIVLTGITATPPTIEIHKTALGAEDTVKWEYFPTAKDAINHLHEKGYVVYAMEQCDESQMMPIAEMDSTKKYAIVLGNEVRGVSQEAIDKCDGCWEIPQYGTKHSLNVSVAAGIALWELLNHLLHVPHEGTQTK